MKLIKVIGLGGVWTFGVPFATGPKVTSILLSHKFAHFRLKLLPVETNETTCITFIKSSIYFQITKYNPYLFKIRAGCLGFVTAVIVSAAEEKGGGMSGIYVIFLIDFRFCRCCFTPSLTQITTQIIHCISSLDLKKTSFIILFHCKCSYDSKVIYIVKLFFCESSSDWKVHLLFSLIHCKSAYDSNIISIV